MDLFKDDLKILGIEESKCDNVTISEVNKAYKKKALKVHPDTSGYESTADFQDLNNAHERALEFLVEKHKDDKPHTDDSDDDAADFF